jgi:ubiquinone/menaquinone biosynthesis C-methylase UbiE
MTTAPAFDSSVAGRYDRFLRPLFFEPYAEDIAARLAIGPAMRVVEVACGTGIVTRHLLGVLPGDATLIATDLSEQMLAVAQQQVSPDSRLAFQPADAMQLPFDDRSFDAAICQFGLMFFPDKARGLREMRRVLRPDGQLLLSTWDSLQKNPVAAMVERVLQQQFPDAPPSFFEIPHHMHDAKALEALARDAGFTDVTIDWVDKIGHAANAREAAMGPVLGTPLIVQLTERSIDSEPIVDGVAQIIAAEFGHGEIEVPLRALIVSARA